MPKTSITPDGAQGTLKEMSAEILYANLNRTLKSNSEPNSLKVNHKCSYCPWIKGMCSEALFQIFRISSHVQ